MFLGIHPNERHRKLSSHLRDYGGRFVCPVCETERAFTFAGCSDPTICPGCGALLQSSSKADVLWWVPTGYAQGGPQADQVVPSGASGSGEAPSTSAGPCAYCSQPVEASEASSLAAHAACEKAEREARDRDDSGCGGVVVHRDEDLHSPYWDPLREEALEQARLAGVAGEPVITTLERARAFEAYLRGQPLATEES